MKKINLALASTALLGSTAKHRGMSGSSRITQNTQYSLSSLGICSACGCIPGHSSTALGNTFCPLEQSLIFNDSAAPGIQSNQLKDLKSSILIVPAVKGMNSQLAFHVRVVYFASLTTKICNFLSDLVVCSSYSSV